MSVEFIGQDAPTLEAGQLALANRLRERQDDAAWDFFGAAQCAGMTPGVAGSIAISIAIMHVARVFAAMQQSGCARSQAEVEEEIVAAFRNTLVGVHAQNRSAAS